MNCEMCKRYNPMNEKCTFYDIRIFCPDTAPSVCNHNLPIDGVECKYCKHCQVWHGKKNNDTFVTIACGIDEDTSDPINCQSFEGD